MFQPLVYLFLRKGTINTGCFEATLFGFLGHAGVVWDNILVSMKAQMR